MAHRVVAQVRARENSCHILVVLQAADTQAVVKCSYIAILLDLAHMVTCSHYAVLVRAHRQVDHNEEGRVVHQKHDEGLEVS